VARDTVCLMDGVAPDIGTAVAVVRRTVVHGIVVAGIVVVVVAGIVVAGTVVAVVAGTVVVVLADSK
jgi:hypothetical protein